MAQRRILTRKRASETNLQSAKAFKLLAREPDANINAMGCYLPEDLILEILIRLPVKSLARFRCVCKHWHSFLTNHKFATNHMIRAQENPNAQKVICFNFDSSLYRVNPDKFETLIYFDKRNMISVNPSAYDKITTLPTEKNSKMLLATLGSCNGLIFLNYGWRIFYLFNPVTGECRRYLFNQPRPEYDHRRGGDKLKLKAIFAFGYDSSTEDYKFVRFRTDEESFRLRVFSLENNSWRKPKTNVQDTPNQLIIPNLEILPAVQVGGFLHWQVISPNPDSIFTLDLAQEKFGQLINIPRDPNEEAKIIGVGVLHGCLCVTRKSIGYTQGCSIWAMKEYGVAESWTKLIKLKALRLDRTRVFPICYIKEGRVLLVQNDYETILYDLEKQSFTESGMPIEQMATSYVESLISPNYNREIKKTRSFRF
ncbi:hypothetical protein COLO4_14583 [Corchorus olitorius]|uniref:F-box domain-containing protein n=1 Tax=Corchorus olitorius TaxID=93759 RepID=A0A1R3JRW4_9ROSI|nr:hypothetical protein COLO4_14583 [Corchorus olitorius]